VINGADIARNPDASVCAAWVQMKKEMLVLRIMDGDADFKQGAYQLIDYLQNVSAAAHGVPLYMFAHNGHSYDWRILTKQLLSHGLLLPSCVAQLCCSQRLFVAEKKPELGRLWSMAHVYAKRFDGARIPSAHTAKGDVKCVARARILDSCAQSV
jgi:hypothetical protein